MTEIIYSYSEGEQEGLQGSYTVTCSREFPEPTLDDMAFFLADFLRASGFTYVDHIVVVTDEGKEFGGL